MTNKLYNSIKSTGAKVLAGTLVTLMGYGCAGGSTSTIRYTPCEIIEGGKTRNCVDEYHKLKKRAECVDAVISYENQLLGRGGPMSVVEPILGTSSCDEIMCNLIFLNKDFLNPSRTKYAICSDLDRLFDACRSQGSKKLSTIKLWAQKNNCEYDF